MNISVLKSVMVLNGDEDFVKNIANILKISRQTASAKLNGKSDFTRDDIALISEHYSLNDDEIQKIFFGGEKLERERSS